MGKRRTERDMIVQGHRVMERPAGFYYQQKDGGELHGPFATLVEALDRIEGIAPEAHEERFGDAPLGSLRDLEHQLDAYAEALEF